MSKNETLEGWVIKSEIVRNYTLVVALLVGSACLIYAVWPTTVEPVIASGGIPVLDLKAFVRNDVSCKDGVAVVAIHQAGDTDKPGYVEPISVPVEGNEHPSPISCHQGEYRLNGVQLTELELGNYALDSAQR
jgi:hypothetical protein